MINLLIGPSGGGKSYEAVVYHILPALQHGRKVITNLPLDVLAIGDVKPEWMDLIEIRHKTRAQKPVVDWAKAQAMWEKFGFAKKEPMFVDRPFANPEDYGDNWRHPETGSGPLYVIDECHKALPRGLTSRAVEEWFAEHRHELADVLLITQSYGKISEPIKDNVQLVYRVRKAVALGAQNRYIRKVQDGPRGEVTNEAIRIYRPEFFKFYKSHTKSSDGVETGANDVRPLWKNWTFAGAAICALLVLGMVAFGDLKNPFNAASHVKVSKGGSSTVSASSGGVSVARPTRVASTSHVDRPARPVPQPEPLDPYGNRQLHLLGDITLGGRSAVYVAVSQGGQGITMISLDELVAAGYSYESFGPCSGVLTWRSVRRALICDAPTVAVSSPIV